MSDGVPDATESPVTGRGPLAGRMVVVTRAADQAQELTRLLEAAGAQVMEVPTIAIEPPDSWTPLDTALENLDRFSWVIFTSANAVTMVEQRLESRGCSLRLFAGKRLAAVGPRTAAALEDRGLEVHALPDDYRAEALVERLRFAIGPRDHVLLPAATEARSVVPDGLRRLGATVTEVPAYVTRSIVQRPEGLLEKLVAGDVDAVTFASPSAARSFAGMFTADERRTWARDVCVACIGPVTAAAAAEHGFACDVVAARQTLGHLVQAIVERFAGAARSPAPENG
jgi:uroporphyrinogen III methyltransferase / synthase